MNRFLFIENWHNPSLNINQVHLSEARVAGALDKLAFMEALVNDKLLLDRTSSESTADRTSLTPSTSSTYADPMKTKSYQSSLNVSGPIQPYHPNLKNFWYPVAFSSDLKDDTMVCKPLCLIRKKDESIMVLWICFFFNIDIRISRFL